MMQRTQNSLAAVGLCALFLTGCHSATTIGTIAPRPPARGPLNIAPGSPPGQQAAGNAPLSPDPALTPGAILAVTRDDICVSGYARKVRHVPEKIKREAYAEYHIAHHQPGEFEVDHLISLELGGSNSLKNLWPESYRTTPWNAHVKDRLENAFHADVCSGRMSLAGAQKVIASDWIAAYKKRFRASLPPAAKSRARLAKDSVPSPTGQVWVNLNSGKYFYPSSTYYGNTKRGGYMSESAARTQGYVAAKGQSEEQ